MYRWPGIDVQLTWQSERTGIENNWFALTGRVIAVKAETDGDLHIELQDAIGDKPGIVVCEIPANRSGVRFGKRFSIGLGQDFRCTFARRGNLR
jgi:hypothetical protein